MARSDTRMGDWALGSADAVAALLPRRGSAVARRRATQPGRRRRERWRGSSLPRRRSARTRRRAVEGTRPARRGRRRRPARRAPEGERGRRRHAPSDQAVDELPPAEMTGHVRAARALRTHCSTRCSPVSAVGERTVAVTAGRSRDSARPLAYIGAGAVVGEGDLNPIPALPGGSPTHTPPATSSRAADTLTFSSVLISSGASQRADSAESTIGRIAGGNGGQSMSLDDFAEGARLRASGNLSRRKFMSRLVAGGMTASAAYAFLNATEGATAAAAPLSTAAVYGTPPGPPRSLTAAVAPVVGSGQVRLSWLLPASDGGSAITGYLIQRFLNGTWNQVGTTAATSFTLSGLSSTTTYTFRVLARNAEGPSTPSNQVNVVPRTVPSAPGALRAVPGDRRVTLSWLLPASNGGLPITDFIVQQSTNGSAFATITDPVRTLPTHTVPGLNNGTRYSFRVLAKNAAGNSAPSNVVNAIPLTMPSAVRSLTATPARRDRYGCRGCCQPPTAARRSPITSSSAPPTARRVGSRSTTGCARPRHTRSPG